MNKLLITLLLISPLSFADWGDVYYCQMTSYSEVSLEGKRINYILEKFQFKLDEAKNAMVFGSSGVFKGSEMELGFSGLPSMEVWGTNNTSLDISFFDEGGFVFIGNALPSAVMVSANCDKF